MMTSEPPLFYWTPATLEVILAVRRWREEGDLAVCYTIDAGPNVHVICPGGQADEVSRRLRSLEGVKKVLESSVGGGAYLLPPESDGV
jgi:diphosphomevalonate decarboxylase